MSASSDTIEYQIRQYQLVRRAAEAATGTINRETSALHRMGTLAVHWGWLDTVPGFPDRLRENPPRQGFFEHPEYLAVRAHLPAPWQDILDLAYYSGWRGTEFIDPVPMNWGKTLTLIGAIRLHGWVVLRTMFATANAERFVAWLTTHLLPRLQAGDVVVMDNLRAHHDPRGGGAVPRARRPPAVPAAILAPTSTRLRPAGPSRNNISASTRRAHPTTCAEWPAAPAPLEYPGHFEVRLVSGNSGIRWKKPGSALRTPWQASTSDWKKSTMGSGTYTSGQ